MPGDIDLHTHSTASDGSDSPRELVRKARDIGLAAIAITDHDTVDGVAEALDEGRKLDFEVVPGIELSTDFRGKTIHVLGYFIDHHNAFLLEKLGWAQRQREARNEKMVARFRELGVDITLDEVSAEAGGDVIGRPHFAVLLQKKKVVASTSEAFREFLGEGAKAYLPKMRFDAPTAISLIRAAGGLPVFAHPIMTGWTPLEIDDAVAELQTLGLAGVEVFYTHHNPSQTLILYDITKRRGLLPTGGSDYHGNIKPHIRLGFGVGDLAVPASFLTGLKKAYLSSKGTGASG